MELPSASTLVELSAYIGRNLCLQQFLETAAHDLRNQVTVIGEGHGLWSRVGGGSPTRVTDRPTPYNDRRLELNHSPGRCYHQHRHTGIKFVMPQQRHSGVPVEICQRRARRYEQAHQLNHRRWVGEPLCYGQLEVVWINKPLYENTILSPLPIVEADQSAAQGCQPSLKLPEHCNKNMISLRGHNKQPYKILPN